MKPSVRTYTSSGFTIVEFLIATGLVSLFFLMGSSVITQLFSFQKDVNKRLMDDFSVVNFHRYLTKDLEGSYWSRYGVFSCPSSSALLETSATASAKITDSSGLLEFVSTDFASTVGMAPGSTRIAVATMRNLAVGDYVLLSLGSDPAQSALFRIDVVHQTQNQIEISPSGLTVGGTSCSFALQSRPVSDFFGTVTQNVFLSRVRVIQYTSEANGVLKRVVLPGGGAETIIDGMNSLTVNSSWTSGAEDAASRKKFGQMNFSAILDYEQSTLAGGKAKNRQQQTLTAQYNLDSFAYSNRYVPSGVPDATKKFPTCAVGYNFMPGVLKYTTEDSIFENMVSIGITGYVSETLEGVTVDVSFAKDNANSEIYCYPWDPRSGGYPQTGVLSTKGNSSTISIKGDGAQFEYVTCAVKGNITVTGSITYFDVKINQTKTINCSADPIHAPTKYRLSGGKPTCDKTFATYDLKEEIVSMDGNPSQPISLGIFGVDMDQSCLWGNANPADFDEKGIAGSCFPWDSANVGKELRRVYLRPYKQTVYNAAGTASAFAAIGNYIDCN